MQTQALLEYAIAVSGGAGSCGSWALTGGGQPQILDSQIANSRIGTAISNRGPGGFVDSYHCDNCVEIQRGRGPDADGNPGTVS